MKTLIQHTAFLILIAITFSQTSCVSAMIDRSTNRHRGLLKSEGSRDTFRSKVGTPISSWNEDLKSDPKYQFNGMYAYDEFLVRGHIARDSDGAGLATVNAVTLCSSEVITIPLSVLSSAAKPFNQQILVVFYDEKLMYLTHHIYEENGKKISNY